MFTYDSSRLDLELYRIRLELGDTDENNPLLQDEEIAIVQSECFSFHSRMAKCCDLICNTFASKGRTKFDNFSEDYTLVYERFKKLANSYRSQSAGSYPWSSSVTVSRKDTNKENSDTVQPSVSRGIHDNI